MTELDNAEAVREAFKDSPKLLDSWLMVGYRNWAKRKKLTSFSKMAKFNKELKGLSREEWSKMKDAVRKKLKNSGT